MIITKRAVTKHNSFAQIWKFLNSVQINIQISPTHFEEKMLLIGNKSVEMIEHFVSFRFAVIFRALSPTNCTDLKTNRQMYRQD